jgi:hypothetical protein
MSGPRRSDEPKRANTPGLMDCIRLRNHDVRAIELWTVDYIIIEKRDWSEVVMFLDIFCWCDSDAWSTMFGV